MEWVPGDDGQEDIMGDRRNRSQDTNRILLSLEGEPPATPIGIVVNGLPKRGKRLFLMKYCCYPVCKVEQIRKR